MIPQLSFWSASIRDPALRSAPPRPLLWLSSRRRHFPLELSPTVNFPLVHSSLSCTLPSRALCFPLVHSSLSSTLPSRALLTYSSLSPMARAALLVLLALLALVQLPEASARIVDSSELHGGSIHSRRVAAAAAAELFAEGHLGDADAGVGAGEQAEEADQDSDEGAENEMPPAVPAPAPDHVQNVVQEMEPEQTWESRYRHGVAPAKLPALETDNAHGYRHSIIHPYGADLHA